ncbi:MAG: DUF2127 domain-containing protein [candidate division NC10 bacterium]|nr:DUF2127 domain-containing protein [candidate division NC10 bacterium]MDE2322357.1 DUF2127 domain-containing protein [candidate division NC10 bacterium]
MHRSIHSTVGQHCNEALLSTRSSGAIRTVALLEAMKGSLVLLAGIGALSLIHHDAQRFAERLVGHLHLNPASSYPRIFLDFAAKATDSRLRTLAAFAAGYALVRLIEAYGLWRERHWAEWFAAVSGGIYIPFEIYKLFRGDAWLSLGALSANIVVVGLMIKALLRGHPVE